MHTQTHTYMQTKLNPQLKLSPEQSVKSSERGR